MQARPMRLTRLLAHHLMQAPDDGPPRRRPQRHAQSKSIDRHGVGSCSGVEIMQNARGQRRECVVASRSHADATTASSIQGLEAGLQRRQRVRLRTNVLHLFYMRSCPWGGKLGRVGGPKSNRRQRAGVSPFWQSGNVLTHLGQSESPASGCIVPTPECRPHRRLDALDAVNVDAS